MKQLLSICLVLWQICWSPLTFAEQKENTTMSVIEQAIARAMHKNDIPGIAVEGYIEGKPYAFYYGYADKKT